MTDQEMKHIADLLTRHRQNTISEDQRMELERWISQNQHIFEELSGDQILEELKQDYLSTRRILVAAKKKIAEVSPFQQPHTVFSERPVYRMFRSRWYVVAAAVILLIGSGILLLLNRQHTSETPQAITATNPDILPGGNRAVLTLSDGRQVNLDSTAAGVVASQGNSQVKKLSNGQIAYEKDATAGSAEKTLVFNTLTIPRGGQYALVLPDGSRVWLNASSSITFPTSFVGPERTVKITGEVFFDVVKNGEHPFHVTLGNADVKVLGTEFNVNAYPDEPEIKTTLLSGAVEVGNAGQRVRLYPGQQAQELVSTSEPKIKVVKDVDVEEVVSWKNGIISFKDADIKSIMRKVARWYDVEVEYQGEIPERIFVGGISRSANLSQILKVLALSKIHFELVDGKKIIVKP